MMTQEQLRLLRRSFSRIKPFAHQLSTQFYVRLFSVTPELRKLFSKDLKAQHAKFMKVVDEMVSLPLLSFPATAGKDAQAYVPGSYWGGMLHGALGVKVDDFEPMKDALLWALVNTPGVEISSEEYAAWSVGYDVLARAMTTGVRQYYVEEGGDQMRARQEPGAAFLNDLSERSDAQEATRQAVAPSDHGLDFLKNVADRAAPR